MGFLDVALTPAATSTATATAVARFLQSSRSKTRWLPVLRYRSPTPNAVRTSAICTCIQNGRSMPLRSVPSPRPMTLIATPRESQSTILPGFRSSCRSHWTSTQSQIMPCFWVWPAKHRMSPPTFRNTSSRKLGTT